MQYDNLDLIHHYQPQLKIKALLSYLLSFSPSILTFSILLLLLAGCQTGTVPSSPQNPATKNETQLNEKQNADYQLALLELDKKNYSKAQSLLLNLNKENPQLAGPLANLGLLHLMQQELGKAEAYLSRALELNSKMPEALNLMGLLSTHNRKIRDAESYYQLALKHKADYSNAHYNLALLYDVYLQNIEKAVQHYRQYLQLIDNTDEETKSWLEQLELTLKQQS